MVCYPGLGPLERSEIRLFWTDSPWRIGRFQEVHRHPIADGSMGSDLIVVLPPIVDLHCGVLQVWEPVLIETLGSEVTAYPESVTFNHGFTRRPGRRLR